MSNIQRKQSDALPKQQGERYLYGFIVTGSSGTNYKISFDAAPGAMYWKCACLGYRRWGQCKHLDACGLKGRKYGKQPLPSANEGKTAQSKGRLLPK